MAATARERLAILVGGGPAPGINSAISSVTIEARKIGLDVIGIYDGFEHLIAGDDSHVRELADRGRLAHPLPGRLHPAHLARQPDAAAPRRWPTSSTCSSASTSATS